MDVLRVGGVQPQRHPLARLADRVQAGARDVAAGTGLDAIGLVPNTTACGGPASERFSPRYRS